MNSSESTLLDVKIANITRVTELYEDTYLPLEAIADQTGLSLSLVTAIIKETGVKRLRSEKLPANTSNSFAESMLDNQVKLVISIFETTTLAIAAITKVPGVHLNTHRIRKIIEANTTKAEREARRIRGVKERGGTDTFNGSPKRTTFTSKANETATLERGDNAFKSSYGNKPSVIETSRETP